MPSQYEADREERIERNKELLKQFGLDVPAIEPKEKPKKKIVEKKSKRKLEEEEEVSNDITPPPAAKRERVTESEPRRSARNAGKEVDYLSEEIVRERLSAAYSSGVKHAEDIEKMGRQEGSKRIHDPKQYGSIPGIAVGTWWETRRACSDDAIHAVWVGGITVGKYGAFSIALSGGYEDDVDLGYAFTFTGSGGRDLKGTKQSPKNLRTGPQCYDQTFENRFNQALMRSEETQKPVRVIRGFKSKSKYAPLEGYRYDGLYVVKKAWQEKGMNKKGHLVCKYAFQRLPGQPPIPVRDMDGEDDAVEGKKNEQALNEDSEDTQDE